MSELKPCPFCGGEAQTLNQAPNGIGYSVGCNDDECRGFIALSWIYATEAIAIAEWNTRAKRTCRNIAEPDEMNDRSFTCSECGARGPYGEGTYHIGGTKKVDGQVMFWDSWPVYKFCPNCGAKVVSE